MTATSLHLSNMAVGQQYRYISVMILHPSPYWRRRRRDVVKEMQEGLTQRPLESGRDDSLDTTSNSTYLGGEWRWEDD